MCCWWPCTPNKYGSSFTNQSPIYTVLSAQNRSSDDSRKGPVSPWLVLMCTRRCLESERRRSWSWAFAPPLLGISGHTHTRSVLKTPQPSAVWRLLLFTSASWAPACSPQLPGKGTLQAGLIIIDGLNVCRRQPNSPGMGDEGSYR